ADVHKAEVRTKRQWFQTAEAEVRFRPGDRARLEAANGFGDGFDVLGCCSAAPADNVEPAIRRKIPEYCGSFAGGFIVTSKSIRQSGVGMATHEDRRDSRKLLNVRTHLFAAERAVD